MRRESFPEGGPITFEVITGSGNVEVLPAGDDETVVELRGGRESEYIIEMRGSVLVVQPPLKQSGKRRFASTDIKIFVAHDSSGEVKTASGDVFVNVGLADLAVATASGNARLTEPISNDLEIKTASGDVKARAVEGHLYIASASGDVTVDGVGGDLRFNSASGDLRTGRVGGVVEIKSVSGDVIVDAVEGHTVRARTLSGDIRLGIPAGRIIDLDLQSLSGDLINRLSKSSIPSEAKQPLDLSIKTVSGDLRLEDG